MRSEPRRIQNIASSEPLVEAATIASTISADASVMIVPPTAVVTARFFPIPNRLAIGYATSKSPLGPWTKADENPILKRTRHVSGPGHNSIVPSPDGKELFVVYHTHRDLDGGYDRELNIDRMIVTDLPDGGVKLRMLGPTRTPQRMPSGVRLPSATTRPVAAGE